MDITSPLGIDVVAVSRSIDLNVPDAFLYQCSDFGFNDRHDVPKKFRIRFINAIAQTLFVSNGRKLVGAGERHLDVAWGMPHEKVRLVGGKTFLLPYPVDDNSSKAS